MLIALTLSNDMFSQANNGNGNGQGKPPIVSLGPANLPFWNLSGNAVSSTGFIGTLNNFPLIVKVNNVQRASFIGSGMDLAGNMHSSFASIDSITTSWRVVVNDALSTNKINALQYFQNDTLVDLLALQSEINSQGLVIGTLNNTVNGILSIAAGQQLEIDSVENEISVLKSEIVIHDSLISNFESSPWVSSGTNSITYFGNATVAGNLQTNSITTAELSISDKFFTRTGEIDSTLCLERDSLSGEGRICTKTTDLGIQSDPNLARNTFINSGNTGRVGIGTRTPTEKLSVDGNVSVKGSVSATRFSSDTISAFRIISPDSIIAFGDSTVFLNTVLHRLYVSDAATAGITIGNARINTTGYSALFQFLAQSALGKNSTAIGYNIRVSQTANNAIVLGSGLQTGSFTGTQSGYLENDKPNSLMVGFNTSGNTPTLFVGSSNGIPNSFGNVGIGTSAPKHTLDVQGHVGLIDHLIFNSTSTNGVINWPETKDLWFRTNAPPGDIYQYTTHMIIKGDGKVGIGKVHPEHKLDVCGTIRSNEWIVENFSCADFVFDENYHRMNFEEKEKWFKEKKHLPGIASAKESDSNGMKAGATLTGIIMNTEENSLDIIDLYKQLQELKKENKILQNKINDLELLK